MLGEEHDIGFSRYPLPGVAHNGYWEDAAVFSHFIGSVVCPKPDVEAPQSKLIARAVSYIGAYLIPFACLLVGVYLLYQASDSYIGSCSVGWLKDAKNIPPATTIFVILFMVYLLIG